jgi:isopentenyl-diphosphate delta-isomerase
VRDIELTEIGVYTYRATDPSTGRVESEYDHVLLGILDREQDQLRPDPTEVASLRWVRPADLGVELRERPDDFAPWLAGVTEVALGVLD